MPCILYIYTQVNRENGLHARQTRQMLSLIHRQNIAIDLLTLPGGDPWPKGLLNALYTTPPVPFVRGMPLYGYGIRRFWATCLITLCAIRLVLSHNYDAIHCADRSIRVGKILAWLFRSKLIFEWRRQSGIDFTQWLKRRSKLFKGSVSLIITDEAQPFDRLRDSGILGKLATLPILPDPAITRTPPRFIQHNVYPAATFHLNALSFSSNLDDLSLLLDALPALLTAFPQLRISIIGGAPRIVERKRRRLARMLPEIAHAIDFHPPMTSSAEWSARFAHADCIFFPSTHASQPPPLLLDAMKAQRAILALSCPAYTALLNPSCATLIHPDKEQLREAIHWMITHPESVAKKSLAAAQRIDSELDVTIIAENFRACYSFALERSTYD